MLIEGFINIFVNIIAWIINMLPEIEIQNVEFVNLFKQFIKGTAYFIPIAALMPILIVTSLLEGFNIFWKIVLRIKSFIPTMGA